MKIDGKLQQEIATIVKASLLEDIGSGDATTQACVPKDLKATASFILKADCVVSGHSVALECFRELDPEATYQILIADGEEAKVGDVLAVVRGNAQALLTAERVALNFMQRMCAIATLTKKFVAFCEGTRAKILDTRKTTPGIRALEKYAVLCGGGTNHRIGLYDKVMIKDNHRNLAAAYGPGGIIRSVKAAREAYPNLEIEVEADTLDEFQEALQAGADIILLDNMDCEQMKTAVEINQGRSMLEASGGINLDTVADVAKTGVDYISVGAVTHSVCSVDISFDIKPGV